MRSETWGQGLAGHCGFSPKGGGCPVEGSVVGVRASSEQRLTLP